MFAGDAKNQSVMSRYYTLFHSPRALGANAMYQNWQHDECRHGLPGMLWVFPPFPLVGAGINKLLFEQVDTVLILRKFMRYWVPMLQQLPVVDEHELSWFDGMYSIGSRAPDHMKSSKPAYVLAAYLVRFSLSCLQYSDQLAVHAWCLHTACLFGLKLLPGDSEPGGPVGVSVVFDILLIAHGSLCYVLVAFVQLHLLVHHVTSPGAVHTLACVHA